ncbi:hypothetical protein V8E36_005815 [Tilletia maclaganii]
MAISTPAPNADASDLPGKSNSNASPSKGRAGTAKVAEAAQATANRATSSATAPSGESGTGADSNKQGSAPAPAANTLTNILGHYSSTARPSTARINPNAAPSTSPIAMTVGNLWRYIPLITSSALSIGSAIASHAIYGPPKKSWGVEMTVFTRIMRDCGTQSEFATIAGLQQFFDLGSLLPVPKDGLITPVTFRVQKRNLRGFLKDADAAEDGKRELTGEWVVTKSTWKRLQSEWRKTGATGAAGGSASVDQSGIHGSSTSNISKTTIITPPAAQRTNSAPALPGQDGAQSGSGVPKLSSTAPNGSADLGARGDSDDKVSQTTSSNPSQSSSSAQPNDGKQQTNASNADSKFKRSGSTRGGPRRERIIYYIHGGAYFVMSAATHRPLTISLSKYAECRVFALNYRLAPDTKFPGALHDCVSAWFRLVEDLGIPPKNIVLGADSAGGGLALALMCYLRDEKYELPAGAMLFSPWVDLTLSCDSWETNAKYDYLPMPPSGDHMNPVHAYLGDNIEQYLTHPYASPLFADLHGLPPLLIQCGDAEVLRDENTLLAHKASLAGVSVRHELYEDCVHVFQAFLFLDASRKALQSARHFMRTALDRPSGSSSRRRSKAAGAASATGKSSNGSVPGAGDSKASAASSGKEGGSVEKPIDPRRKALAAEVAVSSSAEDTGTETEGDDATGAGARKSSGAIGVGAGQRLDAAARDRLDAEMRAGMGNVRGQRVEPSTGERERRHHHHHHHHHGRKSEKAAAGRIASASATTGKVAGEASTAAAASTEFDPAPKASANNEGVAPTPDAADEDGDRSSSGSSSSEDDGDDDEDEEFAYARTKKGSLMGSAASSLTSSAAAAFKAMQANAHSAHHSSASSSSHYQLGAGSSSAGRGSGAGAANVDEDDDEDEDAGRNGVLSAFHPPVNVLTPRIRQSSLGGGRPLDAIAAMGTSDQDNEGAGASAGPDSALVLDAIAAGNATESDTGSSSSSSFHSAAGSGNASPSSTSAAGPTGARPPMMRTRSSVGPGGGGGAGSVRLLSNSSSAALSSLFESYAANPGALRTNVYTPGNEDGPLPVPPNAETQRK